MAAEWFFKRWPGFVSETEFKTEKSPWPSEKEVHILSMLRV